MMVNCMLKLLAFFATLVLICAEIPYDRFVDKAFDHQNVCNQPKETGPCRASVPRWYFDKSSGQCTNFVYGGCDGNSNNFETKGYCKRVCIDKNPCATPSLQRPPDGSRYDESLGENGCPKFVLVHDVKNGKCPADHPKAHGNSCLRECDHSDERCPGAEKCCKIGCNRLCVPPAT